MSVRRFSNVLLSSVVALLAAGCAAGATGDGSDGLDAEPQPGDDGGHDAVSEAETGGMTMDGPAPSYDTGAPDGGSKPDVGVTDGAKDADFDAVHESGSDAKKESGADAAKDAGKDAPLESGSEGGSVPTTCKEADDKIGCCDGNVLYYCNPTLASKTCTGTKVCGWDTSSSFYDCVAPPGGADPMGTYPIACE